MTAEDKQAWRDETTAIVESPGAPEIFVAPSREALARMEFPAHHPVFDELEVARDGNVWIRTPRPEDDEGPYTWSVFDREGVWQTDVRTPADLSITEFGDDYVLGGWRDDLGIEYVRMYAIEKGGG